jgi:hypothetical protein
MRNGGIIGGINTPTTSVASGVWGLSKQQRSLIDGDLNFDSVSVLIQPTADAVASDVGPTGHTITEVADANVTADQSKWDGYSIVFDGTGDYLDCPADADFNLGTGDFTIEGWVKTTTAATVGGYSIRLFQIDGPTTSTTAGNLQVFLNNSTGALRLYEASLDSSGSTALTDNAWHHWAVSRVGTALKGFVDGVQEISITSSLNITANSATPRPRIGAHSSTQGTFTGYMDAIRVTKGVGRYTGNFVAPTAAFPTKQSSAATWPPPYEYAAPATTKLYLPFDTGPIAGATPGYALVGGIADASQYAHTITVHGDAAVTTDQQKFGTHSLYLDGTGDYLELPIHSDFDTTTGVDLTLEFWYRQSSAPSGSTGPLIGFGINASVGADNDILQFGNNTDVLYAMMYNGTIDSYAISSAGAIANDSTWRHYSFNYDHSATTMKIYKDGTLIGTDTSFSTVPTRAGGRVNKMFIGGTWGTGGGTFYITGAGHYDDLKFINGAILRTGNFTAPSAASGE